MAISNKFLHFTTKAAFLNKISEYVTYNESNNSYYVSSNKVDAWNMFKNYTCFIKDTKEIWTHETFYDASTLSGGSIEEPGKYISGITVSKNNISVTKGTLPVYYGNRITINGRDNILCSTIATPNQTFYAPTSAGNAGQVLVSTGSTPEFRSLVGIIPVATTTQIGGIKLGYSTNNKNYALQVDSNGLAYVNVPWENSGTASGPTYGIATTSVSGLVKPISVISTPTINSISNTAGKYYHVQMNSTGNMFVNIPWTDSNTTYSIATASTAGLVKPSSVIAKPSLNSITTTSNRYYHVQMSSDGNMFVNVPWVSGSYTLPTASASTLGGVKIGNNITVSSGTISLTSSNITSALGFTPANANSIPTIPTTLPNPSSLTINGTSYNGSTAVNINLPKFLTVATLSGNTVNAGYSYNNTTVTSISTLSGFNNEKPDTIIISTQKITFTASNAIKMDGLADLSSGSYYIYTLHYMANGKIAINCATYSA